jgi:hypothetical protein
MDSVFEDAFTNPDFFLARVISGIAKSEKKWNDGLAIVDEQGNPLPFDVEQLRHNQ